MSLSFGAMVIGHGWFNGASSSGKSAVQLLQESKSRYVKSDRVLVTSQEPSRPDRFHISKNPNIFLSASVHTLHALRPPSADKTKTNDPSKRPSKTPPPVPPRSHVPPRTHVAPRIQVIPLTSVALALHTGSQSCTTSAPPLPTRSPRVAPRPRAKTQPVGDVLLRGGDLRRSLSHGPGDRSNDVQMKLRQLLNTDSKESLCPLETTDNWRNVKIGNEDGTFRAVVAAVTAHKSLPELFLMRPNDVMEQLSESKLSCDRRPSCPGAILSDAYEKTPTPPPRPPRWTKESPPIVPARPPPRPPPPKISLAQVQSLPKPKVLNSSAFSHNADGEASSESGLSGYGHGSDTSKEEPRRRPILRSKSDVSHERHGSLGNRWEEDSRRSSYCSEELNLFFNSMGLDVTTLRDIESPTKSFSSPVYFEETSSQDSGLGVRRGSSDSDDVKIPIISTGQHLTKRSAEPSIIEKNARVIKWLFNCQKARSVSFPRSLSSGS